MKGNKMSNETSPQSIFPKWLINGLGGLLIIFIGFLIIQQIYNFSKMVQNQKPTNTISVSGEGKIVAVPDLATLTVGVSSQGQNSKEVQDKNNEKINKITNYLKEQAIDSKDITTSQFSSYPNYDYQSGAKIIGYQASQTVTIKIHGIDKEDQKKKLEIISGGVVDNGVNTVSGVFFSFEDAKNLEQQARKAAIANAKEKAIGLAKEAGLTLGKVVSISEGQGTYPRLYNSFDSVMPMAAGVAEKSVTPPSMEPGSQDISQSMTVVFEVK